MRKNRGILDSDRLALLRSYLSSSLTRYEFEKKMGLSYNTIKHWLRIFMIEDKPNAYEMRYKKETISEDRDYEKLKNEMRALKLRARELEHELKLSNMARDAYDCMIDLAEDKYGISIRKNSDAK